MKIKNGVKIEEEEQYPEPPKDIELLRNTISSMERASRDFEKNFKEFDKSPIPKEFLYLCWHYKEQIEQLIYEYRQIDGSHYSWTKVGKPENIEAKRIALQCVESFQSTNKDPNKLPTASYLHKAIDQRITRLILDRQEAPEMVSERTCSVWLTQMKRGIFKIEDDKD